jgi:hypothetical protein
MGRSRRVRERSSEAACVDAPWASVSRARGGRDGRCRGLANRGPGGNAGTSGHGPTFLLARVERLEGHFLGDPPVRVATDRIEFGAQVVSLLGDLRASAGAPISTRLGSLGGLTRTIGAAGFDRLRPCRDPLDRAPRQLCM